MLISCSLSTSKIVNYSGPLDVEAHHVDRWGFLTHKGGKARVTEDDREMTVF